MCDGGSVSGSAVARRLPDTFLRRLALIVAVGLGVRVAYAVAGGGTGTSYDGAYYHLAGVALADGRGFVNPLTDVPTALHPPAWPAVLALPSVVGLDTLLAHQLVAAVIGAGTVALVAVVARSIAGARVGLIGASIAALHPSLWLRERELAAETLAFPLVALALLLAYRYWERPRTGTLVMLGIVCGALALVRAEQAALLVVLLPPLALLRPGNDSSARRLASVGAAGVAAVLVLLPWVARNATTFERPVILTSSLGVNIRAGNCPGAYHGEHLGSYDPEIWRIAGGDQAGACSQPPESVDESVQEAELREKGIAFARENAGRLPAVLAAREGRTWSVFRPLQEVRFAQEWGGGPHGVYLAGLVSYWLLLPFAALGVLRMREIRLPVFPLLTFVAISAVAVAITFGSLRFRAPADVSIVLLAAVGVDSVQRRLGRTRWMLRRRERVGAGRYRERDRRASRRVPADRSVACGHAAMDRPT